MLIDSNGFPQLPIQFCNVIFLLNLFMQVLALNKNPLSSLPEEILRAPARNLCEFLRLYDSGSDMALQARVMLIGEENVCALFTHTYN